MILSRFSSSGARGKIRRPALIALRLDYRRLKITRSAAIAAPGRYPTQSRPEERKVMAFDPNDPLAWLREKPTAFIERQISGVRHNLRNGNPSGDPQSAPRCGARARTRANAPCRAPAVRGGKRCRMHGGGSSGPKTPEGRERSRRARLKHGKFSRIERQRRDAEAARQRLEVEATLRARGIIGRLFRRRRQA